MGILYKSLDADSDGSHSYIVEYCARCYSLFYQNRASGSAVYANRLERLNNDCCICIRLGRFISCY